MAVLRARMPLAQKWECHGDAQMKCIEFSSTQLLGFDL